MLLTLPGPFTLLPYKQAVAWARGKSYAYALDHFLPGHSRLDNLALHFLALVSSLAGQQSLMHAIHPALPWFTAAASATLILSASPVAVAPRVAALVVVTAPPILSYGIATWPTMQWEQALVVCWLSVQIQALSHIVTGEKPTLSSLPTMEGEMSHTAYFPLLLLEACSHALSNAVNAHAVDEAHIARSTAHDTGSESTTGGERVESDRASQTDSGTLRRRPRSPPPTRKYLTSPQLCSPQQRAARSPHRVVPSPERMVQTLVSPLVSSRTRGAAASRLAATPRHGVKTPGSSVGGKNTSSSSPGRTPDRGAVHMSHTPRSVRWATGAKSPPPSRVRLHKRARGLSDDAAEE